jgi:hypothetical protein
MKGHHHKARVRNFFELYDYPASDHVATSLSFVARLVDAVVAQKVRVG